MRYRPLGASGTAVSAVSLRLAGERCRGSAQAWLAMIHAAFENGINAFEIENPTEALLQGFGEAHQALERRLFFIGLRLAAGSTAPDIERQVAQTVETANVRNLDLVSLDADGETHTDVIWTLEELRSSRKTRLIGVAGESDAVVPHIASGVFDLLSSPFSILSGWRERLRVRTAMEHEMAVVAVGHFPPEARELAKPSEPKRGWFAKAPPPLAGVGAYEFLHRTPGWTPEEICLAFSLTEPSLASVRVDPESIDHMAALAEVTERELPAAVAAQIEMARFSAEGRGEAERRSA
jgi:aryl-alcohol dehydrogenase-like predicted oxidoreductase